MKPIKIGSIEYRMSHNDYNDKDYEEIVKWEGPTCYSVAFIEWNSAHDEFDVRSIGTRAFHLEEEDFKDFKRILKLINETNY